MPFSQFLHRVGAGASDVERHNDIGIDDDDYKVRTITNALAR